MWALSPPYLLVLHTYLYYTFCLLYKSTLVYFITREIQYIHLVFLTHITWYLTPYCLHVSKIPWHSSMFSFWNCIRKKKIWNNFINIFFFLTTNSLNFGIVNISFLFLSLFLHSYITIFKYKNQIKDNNKVKANLKKIKKYIKKNKQVKANCIYMFGYLYS